MSNAWSYHTWRSKFKRENVQVQTGFATQYMLWPQYITFWEHIARNEGKYAPSFFTFSMTYDKLNKLASG